MTAHNRIQRYLDMREAKPMPQLGDGIHCVNPGTEFEGTLSLSDLRELSSQYREMLEAFKRILASDGMRPGHVEYLSRADITAIAKDAIDRAEAQP